MRLTLGRALDAGLVPRLIAKDAAILPAMRTLAGHIPGTATGPSGSFSGAGARDRRRPHVSAVAPGGAPGAEETAATTGGRQSAAAPAADGDQSRVGVRFVFDTCADGRTLKCLTVIDEFTRECLAIDVAGGIRSGRVIEVLTQLVSVHGAPRYLRSDNGPEFVARAILRWLQSAQIETAFIDPGSRGRTARTNPSTGSCATSTSRCSGSAIAPTRRSASSNGDGITTRCVRTRVSGT